LQEFVDRARLAAGGKRPALLFFAQSCPAGVTSKQIDRAAPEKEQAANRDTANRRKKLVEEAGERSEEPDYVEISAQQR
jgi:hypothetical protein